MVLECEPFFLCVHDLSMFMIIELILCFFLLTDDTASNSSNSQKVMLHLPVTYTCHSQVLMLHVCCFWIGLLELTDVAVAP